MAGKNPAFQFYPGDWSRDLEEHPLEIEGAWIRICCKLWWSETRGKLERTVDQWAKILRVYPQDAERILIYINSYKIGDVLTLPNGNLTVISRRMLRDEKERQNNCLRQKRHYDKQKPNADPSANSQDSSVLLSSSSIKKQVKKEAIQLIENRFETIPDALMKKWREVAPGISINDEIKKAELWLLAHPEKRRSRWGSFLSNWMVRAQENFIKYGGSGNGKHTNDTYQRGSQPTYARGQRQPAELSADVLADIAEANRLATAKAADKGAKVTG
jgi:hypothetical protein